MFATKPTVGERLFLVIWCVNEKAGVTQTKQ